MASWDLLDEKGEAELHKTRLLNVEEKPFKRVAKRISTISSLVTTLGAAQNDDATPPPKSEADSLREDLLLDFAAFDSNIARLQYLHDANTRERERYQADQQRIMGECQDVRANNARLREQLEGAQATLAQRKKFDELAEKITSNRLLKPRSEQLTNLEKLEEECKELDRESETYRATWKERKDQFNRIHEEGVVLRRQIRDEKEEVDRREGMNEGAEEEDAGERPGQTPRIDPAGSATPRPEGDTQAKADGEAGTPQITVSNGDAARSGDTPGPESARVALGTPAAESRPVTPATPAEEEKADTSGDVDMENGGQDTETQENNGDSMEVDR